MQRGTKVNKKGHSVSYKGNKISSLQKNALRLSLVSKLSSALKVKYKNLFLVSGYDDKELYNDINEFLTTKYQTKVPKEVFVPVEEEILKRLKAKNPTMRYKKENSLPKKSTSANKLAESLQTEQIVNHSQIMQNKEENEEKKEEREDTAKSYRVIETEPHVLVDKLKMRMENDFHARLIREQNKKYIEEQKAIKINKYNKNKEVFDYLQRQIEEKEKIKQLKREEEIKKSLQMQEEERQRWLEIDRIKKLKREKEIEECQKSFEMKQKEKQAQAMKQSLYKLNPNGYFNDDDSIRKQKLFREKFQKDCEKYALLREEYLHQEKEKRMKEDEIYKKQCEELMKKDGEESRLLKQRIMARIKSQEKIEGIMKQIFDGRKKAESVRYIKEREEQERKKQIEYEKEEMKRKEKIEEMKKSLDMYILSKQQEKEKKRELDEKIKAEANKEYNDFLIAEKERKKLKEEKMRKYRLELDKQIKENEVYNKEKLMYSYGTPYKNSLLTEEEEKAIQKQFS